jgi:hypothetical protein
MTEYLHEGAAVPASPGTAQAPAVGAGTASTALVPFAHWAIADDDVSKHPPPGPFGRILAAIYRNRRLTARHLRRDELDARGADALAGDAAALVRLAHRNLLPLLGICTDHPPDVFVLTEVRLGPRGCIS